MKIPRNKKQICLAVLMLLSTAVSAQYRAGVQGVVTDQSGALVPEASVTVFGHAQSGLTGRVINVQARLSF